MQLLVIIYYYLFTYFCSLLIWLDKHSGKLWEQRGANISGPHHQLSMLDCLLLSQFESCWPNYFMQQAQSSRVVVKSIFLECVKITMYLVRMQSHVDETSSSESCLSHTFLTEVVHLIITPASSFSALFFTYLQFLLAESCPVLSCHSLWSFLFQIWITNQSWQGPVFKVSLLLGAKPCFIMIRLLSECLQEIE